MKINYDSWCDQEKIEKLKRLEPILAEAVKPDTKIYWHPVERASGEPAALLCISHYADQLPDSATTKFSFAELDNHDGMRAKFHRLWGDLLQNRCDRQMQKVRRCCNSGDAPLDEREQARKEFMRHQDWCRTLTFADLRSICVEVCEILGKSCFRGGRGQDWKTALLNHLREEQTEKEMKSAFCRHGEKNSYETTSTL